VCKNKNNKKVGKPIENVDENTKVKTPPHHPVLKRVKKGKIIKKKTTKKQGVITIPSYA